MYLKKLAITLICLLMTVNLVGCGNNNWEEIEDDQENPATALQNEQEVVIKNIDRFSNININEKGERYFDIEYSDFLDNYNYYLEVKYADAASNYTVTGADAVSCEGFYTNEYGTEVMRNWFPSILSGQHVYVDEFSNHIGSVSLNIDNSIYNKMSENEKNIIKEQVELVSMALLPEMDYSFYEDKIWSVLKKSIIDNEEKAIAVEGQVCFYTYNSDDNERHIRIYPKKEVTYQQPQEDLPLSEAVIGKWRGSDGSIWEYKNDGTFTIDFSTYRPEDRSPEADILRKQDILVIPYTVNGDYIVFEMGKAQYSNYTRIKNGFKYETSSVGRTQSTMKKVD